MKYIKGIHQHGSETFLTILKNDINLEKTAIIKSSSTKNGIQSIITEKKGIDWYNIESKNKIEFDLEKKTDNYYRIIIKTNKSFFNISSNASYLNITKYLDLTIKHYIEIWRKYKNNNYAPLHGDLSLIGNVMFNNDDEVLFIDWEQFDSSMKMPTGCDIIITLIENVYYEIVKFKKINKQVYQHIINSVCILKKSGLLSPLLFHNPAENTLNYINSNKYIWNGQFFKLPALKLSKSIIYEIDNAVNKIL